MPNFDKIVSLLMSGDTDIAAVEFVDQLFDRMSDGEDGDHNSADTATASEQ